MSNEVQLTVRVPRGLAERLDAVAQAVQGQRARLDIPGQYGRADAIREALMLGLPSLEHLHAHGEVRVALEKALKRYAGLTEGGWETQSRIARGLQEHARTYQDSSDLLQRALSDADLLQDALSDMVRGGWATMRPAGGKAAEYWFQAKNVS